MINNMIQLSKVIFTKRKRNKKTNNNNNNNNWKDIIELSKYETSNFYTVFNELHSKASTLIAFHGAIIVFAVDYSQFNHLYAIYSLSSLEKFFTITNFIFSIFTLCVALSSIILLISVLWSSNILKPNINGIGNEHIYGPARKFNKVMFDNLKNNLSQNYILLNKKHKRYNASLILTIIEMSIIVLNIIIKII